MIYRRKSLDADTGTQGHTHTHTHTHTYGRTALLIESLPVPFLQEEPGKRDTT